MATVRHASGPRATRYQLSLCTTDELQKMLIMVFETTDQVIAFAALIQDELIKRGETPRPVA